MRSLLTGEISAGADALSVEPSAALAGVFGAAGAGVKGVETEHANVAASRHRAPQIVAVFTISWFSRVWGLAAAPRGTVRYFSVTTSVYKDFVSDFLYLQPAPSHVVDPRGIHCQGRPMSPR